jgi:hypothetical protein
VKFCRFGKKVMNPSEFPRHMGALGKLLALTLCATMSGQEIPKPPSAPNEFFRIFGAQKNRIKSYARERAIDVAHLIETEGTANFAQRFNDKRYAVPGFPKLSKCLAPVKINQYSVSACKGEGALVTLVERGAQSCPKCADSLMKYIYEMPIDAGIIDGNIDGDKEYGLGLEDTVFSVIHGPLISTYSFKLTTKSTHCDEGLHRVYNRSFSGIREETIAQESIHTSLLGRAAVINSMETSAGYGELLYYIQMRGKPQGQTSKDSEIEVVRLIYEQQEIGISRLNIFLDKYVSATPRVRQ